MFLGKLLHPKELFVFINKSVVVGLALLSFMAHFHLVFLASIEGKYSRMDHIKFVEDSF